MTQDVMTQDDNSNSQNKLRTRNGKYVDKHNTI